MVGMQRSSVDVGKQQILVLQLPGPEPQPQLKLCLAMLAQHIDQKVGQGDCAAACCSVFRVLKRLRLPSIVQISRQFPQATLLLRTMGPALSVISSQSLGICRHTVVNFC